MADTSPFIVKGGWFPSRWKRKRCFMLFHVKIISAGRHILLVILGIFFQFEVNLYCGKLISTGDNTWAIIRDIIDITNRCEVSPILG